MRTAKPVSLVLLAAALLLGPAHALAQEIKVGALLAVTGPAAFLGDPEAKTLEMLVDEVNAKGGIDGHKVKLIIKDTQASAEKAVSFAKQLIEEEKVLAILGPTTSGESMAIKALVEGAGMLNISCAAAEVIVNPVARHVFKTPQSDSQAVTHIFQQMKKMGISKIGVLSSNSGFGKAGKGQIEKMAPEAGVQIVANEVYDTKATDLTAEVTKVKGAGVQAIVNWSIEPAQSIVIKNIRQLGLTIPVFQSHGFGNPKFAEAAGAAAEGVIFPAGRLTIVDSLPAGHPQKALLTAYDRDYRARYKEVPSTFGGHAYDAFTILAEAVRRAHSTETAKVRDAVEKLTGFVGTAGTFNFSPTDHMGLDLSAFEMQTVKGGKFVPLAK
jgi:branched-chain amino acid transport system substrate-binding protein